MNQNATAVNSIILYDTLTGLYNRQYLKIKFRELRTIKERLGINVSMIMIDINNFRTVNDASGYEAGNQLLVDFADICRMNTRKDFDFVFRVGGDEFLILTLDSSLDECEDICQRVNRQIAKQVSHLSISYGITQVDTRVELSTCIDECDRKLTDYKLRLSNTLS